MQGHEVVVICNVDMCKYEDRKMKRGTIYMCTFLQILEILVDIRMLILVVCVPGDGSLCCMLHAPSQYACTATINRGF